MKLLRVSIAAFSLMTALAFGQSQPKPADTATPTPMASSAPSAAHAANPEDVKSPEAIVTALYNVISGPAGPRDWARFHSLFIQEGRLIFNGVNDKGEFTRRIMSPDDYEKRAGAFFMKEGFVERGISNQVEQFGHIAHFFSTYESRHEKDGTVFARGINTIELASDGQRWYIVEIMWDQESKTNPIPEKYLSTSDSK